MENPLVRFPDAEILLPLRYFGSIGYYAMMAAYGRARLNLCQRFNKRDKEVHRMDLQDVHGHLSLTVPIEKPVMTHGATWKDIGISDHASWWHVHKVALESSYGRTPYFEFYIDRLLPFFTHSNIVEYGSIAVYDIEINKVICDILGISRPEIVDDVTLGSPHVIDKFQMPAYWQIRAEKFGFMSDLSILDLIFSLGPEAAIYLYHLYD